MDKGKQRANQTSAGAASTHGRGRRRLLQGGLGAAPLLVTLASRPVLGQTQCVSTSAALSMPTSHQKAEVCTGYGPSYWSQPQNFNQWPSPYSPTTQGGLGGNVATTFASVFQPSPYPSDTTFLAVLNMAGPSDRVARYIVAARLNVAKGLAPVLSESSLQTIWLEYASTGYFEPTAGVKWYQDEIVAYLESTMPHLDGIPHTT